MLLLFAFASFAQGDGDGLLLRFTRFHLGADVGRNDLLGFTFLQGHNCSLVVKEDRARRHG